LDSALQSIWYRTSPPPLPLRALSRLFGLIVRARRAAYRRRWLRAVRLPRPVIVVGNLSVGGSGKTPLVIWLAQRLRAAGLAPGIVLRGYGGSAARANTPLQVESDSDPAVVGDEAVLLRQRSAEPVAVGRDRASAARLLLRQGVDVIISDDGLQHLALARDFEIAVIDGERGLGNGWLLPAGPLREPRSRLSQVDATVINGEGAFRSQWAAAGPRPLLMRLAGDCLLPLGGGAGTLPLSNLAGSRVHAVAGIGHPGRFFSQLRSAGLAVIEHPFPDHHRFRADELAFGDGLPLLTTEKDAVKCRQFGGPNRWYLPVSAVFAEADAAALLERLRHSLTAEPITAGD
jgi:tetraacyldisaccharide 4'-kinase